MPRRVAVIGVDCLTPQLLFERFAEDLPTVGGMMRAGAWGRLRSTIPPITVPAWICMASSQDPGQIGLYGFRNRVDHGYGDMAVADATWVRVPTLWQLLARRRRRSIVVGVPLTFPPRPIVGDLVSGIPIPADAEEFTAPPQLRAQLDAWSGEGGYVADVGDFRTRATEDLLRALTRLRDNRFEVVTRLAQSRTWDLLFAVDMSVDRLHHALWAHAHPEHPLHDPGSPFKDELRRFYIGLDAQLGALLEALGPETAVLVVSDHGAQTMRGGIRFNEWLLQQGLLTLRRRPARTSRLRLDDIDWARTRAWADGGYYARVFFNVAGREPAGVVEDLEGFRAELIARLEQMTGPAGEPLGNKVFVPEQCYRACHNVPPDLIVYPGDLAFRANATVLAEPLPSDPASLVFTRENDTGVDGANHAQDGIWMYRAAAGDPALAGERVDASIYDIAPTALQLLGEPIPPHMIGAPLARLG